MNVALINKNPAVSRLITLSLNKIGAQYVEIDDVSKLENRYDYLIVDSDADIGDVDFSVFSGTILSLVPRGGKKPEFATTSLEKPFLPTEFLAVFEQYKPKQSAVDSKNLDENLEDFKFESEDELEEISIPDIDTSLESEILGLNADESGLDEFSFDEKDEILEDKFDDLDENIESKPVLSEHENEFENIGSLVDEIENMQDFSIDQSANNISDEELVAAFDDENLRSNDQSAIEQTKNELDQIEALDENLQDEFLVDESALAGSTDENLDTQIYALKPDNEAEINEFMVNESVLEEESKNLEDEFLVDESSLLEESVEPVNFDDANETDELNLDQAVMQNEEQILDKASNENIADKLNLDDFTVDEIALAESTDENLDTQIYALKPDNEAGTNEPKEESIDEFIVDESVLEEESKNLEDEFLVDESSLLEDNVEPVNFDDADETDELNLDQAVMQNKEQILDKTPVQIAQEEDLSDQILDEISTQETEKIIANSIDDISEAQMLQAFGVSEIQEAQIQESDAKAKLREKIAEEIASLLNEGTIKDMLKDMKINVNVSFEEK